MFTILCNKPHLNQHQVHFKFDIGTGPIEDMEFFDTAEEAKRYLLSNLNSYFLNRYSFFIQKLKQYADGNEAYKISIKRVLSYERCFAFFDYIFNGNHDQPEKIAKYATTLCSQQTFVDALPVTESPANSALFLLQKDFLNAVNLMNDCINDKIKSAV